MERLLADISGSTASLLVLGMILSASILADTVARHTRLPRISLLVLVGVGFAVIQQLVLGQANGSPLGRLGEPLINLALVMVAFLLGGQLTLKRLRKIGPLVLVLSLSVIVVGALVVGLGLAVLGYPLAVVVSLAAISVATDPAAVTEAIHELRDNSFRARVITGIVAIDDAWGIIVFGLAVAILSWMGAGEAGGALLHSAWELGGAVLLGMLLGFPIAWLTGRLRPGEPTQVEALAVILLMTGLASLFQISSLLMAMVAGSVVANFSFHHTRSFNEIEHIEWPFLVFFFVLSGASIDLRNIWPALWLILSYIVLRVVGRYLGGWVGTSWQRRGREVLPGNIGLALTPQAGVAMGMALLAAERFPDVGAQVVATVVTSTVFFELIGPLWVRRVLRR